MQGYEDAFDDLKTHRFATMIEVGEPDYYPVDDLNKVKPEATCRGCSLSGPCPALYRGYHDVYGHDELSPVVDRPRSNSFNYTFEALVTASAEEGRCPLRDDGVSPWEPGRHLFVKNGSRIARFFADTRDFSDAELLETKKELGQVYVDVSSKDAPDEFTRDLRPLVRSALCEGCVHVESCTGMYEPRLADDVFTRDDARVRELLRALEGDVLDVGCGEGRYHDVIEERVASGAIRYAAFDPSEPAIAKLEARFPTASLRVLTAEAWCEEVECEEVEGREDGSQDHVLVLRSWNHLVDPHRFARAAARALRPGGSLTVVDDTAFGLARTRQKSARAERSAAVFEHYRNDTAADAARVIDETELELVERRDVGPGTSTLWLLRYVAPRDRRV
jgi:SAM-dependent methyltransferase